MGSLLIEGIQHIDEERVGQALNPRDVDPTPEWLAEAGAGSVEEDAVESRHPRRERRPVPAIDTTLYVAWNAM